jgi:hypothetical protein
MKAVLFFVLSKIPTLQWQLCTLPLHLFHPILFTSRYPNISQLLHAFFLSSFIALNASLIWDIRICNFHNCIIYDLDLYVLRIYLYMLCFFYSGVSSWFLNFGIIGYWYIHSFRKISFWSKMWCAYSTFSDFFKDTVVCNGNYIGYLPLSVPSYMYSYFTYLYMPNYVSWLHGAGKRYGWQWHRFSSKFLLLLIYTNT